MKLITIHQADGLNGVVGRVLNDTEIIRPGDLLNARSNSETAGWIPVDADNCGKTVDHPRNSWAIVLRPCDPLIAAMIEARDNK